MIDFPKVFWDFQKWTFIFVHFLLSEKGFGTKNRIFARLGGNFWVPHPKKIYILGGLKDAGLLVYLLICNQ